MKITDLFIRRPVLAVVVNLVIVIAGVQAIRSLNVRQYPKLESATVTVRTPYVGANADVVRGFITTPLERGIAAADGIDFIASQSVQGLSTINVRLSAVRKLVGEARRNNMIGSEEAASLTDIPNTSQKGTRLGNWLTREQAKELLAIPNRATLKSKRDYVILALLVGCALRRNELAELDVATIQQREGRWVLADLEGKGRRIRTVAIPQSG